MFNKLYQIVWEWLLPQHTLTRLSGALANARWPRLKNFLIRWCIRHYQIDLSSAAKKDINEFATFNEFFTRALTPEARPIAADKNAIACPADGFICQIGAIEQSRILQAKGAYFDVTQLLGGDKLRAAPFINGHFVNIYLSPRDYHRVHMPVSGTLQSMTYIPGRLFTVNQTSAARIPQLFARNERVACLFDTEWGPMALVLVGAILVGSIATPWAGVITPPRAREINTIQYQPNEIVLSKGAEMGRFQFGSTAIALFSNPTLQWSNTLQPALAVKMGQALGSFLPA